MRLERTSCCLLVLLWLNAEVASALHAPTTVQRPRDAAALGLAADGSGADERAVETATADGPADSGDFVSSLQRPLPASGAADGLQLTAASLLGRFGLSAADVLKELAPHLAGCTLRLRQTSARLDDGAALHEVYDLYFGAYPLDGASLSLHHLHNRLVMVRAALPAYRLPETPPTAVDFLALASLGYADVAETALVTPVIAQSGGFPAPAWLVHRKATIDDRGVDRGASSLLIDAQTGAVLREARLGFDLGRVYPRGPADGRVNEVALEGLPTTGYLDGEHFAVYAPDEGDPRAQAPDMRFDYLPDDPADALAFDQVETYYGATKALAFFRDKLGYDIGATQVKIRINTLIDGQADNAQYLPPPVGPEIRIGKGDANLSNLARDTDVVMHEFGHHVIYPHLQSRDGESGVLHEGTADYFTYAINGDPHLGTSLLPGGALRTALLDPSARYDALEAGRSAHFRGQYWSAVLWEIRQSLGPDADHLVYETLPYLGASSGLRDAFLGLVNADRDRFPLAEGAPEAGIYGRNKCLILGAAVRRGFGAWLEDLDGSSCGLDLHAEAAKSRDLLQHKDARAEPTGRNVGVTLFGRTCSVVAATGGRDGAPGSWLFWLLLTPLALGGARPFARGRRRGP